MGETPGLDEAQRHVSPARHGQDLLGLHRWQVVDVGVRGGGPLDLGQQGAGTDENHVRACHLLKRAPNQGNVATGRQVARMQVQERLLGNPQACAQVDDPLRARRSICHDDGIHARVGLAVPLRDRLVDHGHHVRPVDIVALNDTLEALAQARRPHRLSLQLVRVVGEHRARAPSQGVREGQQEEVLRGDGANPLAREPPIHPSTPRPDDPQPTQGRTQGGSPDPREAHGGGHGLVGGERALIDADDLRA